MKPAPLGAENKSIMPGPQTPFWLVLVFAVVLPLVASALVALLVRSAHRAERVAARLRAGELFRLLGGGVAGRIGERDLRRAVSRADHEPFWDAMEAITLTLRPRERRDLARSLRSSAHLARERRLLAGSEPAARRELAARRLGMLPGARGRRVLRGALARGPESVSLAAARSLARHRDLKALHWLLEHPSALARRPLPALSGLLRSFGPGARAVLIGALERGIAQPRVECACIDALGMSRCRSARETIARRLQAPHLELRVAAARALGQLGMGEAIPALVPALADHGWPVRAMAAQALGRLGATPAVEALSACVSDRSWWVRHHAAYALAALGDEGRGALCELAARASDTFAREMAREALDSRTDARRA